MSLGLNAIALNRAVAGVVFGTLCMSGCTSVTSDDPGPAPKQNADPATDAVGYSGWYVSDFAKQVRSYAGEDVTLSGEVGQFLTPHSFTIANPEDPGLVPLLVVSGDDTEELRSGQLITVTGEVNDDFTVASAVEEMNVELDPARHSEFRDLPFIEASNTSVPAPR